MLIIFFNIIILLSLPLLMLGVINKTKAFWSARLGASIFQPYYDFIKLLKKGAVISNTSSFLFILFPSLSFSAILLAGFFVPLFANKAILNIDGGFIVFASLLAVAKFFTLIGAMDTGSSFEGMGVSREASFSTMVEPAFFITMASMVAFTGNFSFQSLSLVLHKTSESAFLVVVLSMLIFFLLLLVETGRVPIDDPDTHLELTMIHEVMVLDNSGFDLALLNFGVGLKILIFSSLITNFLIPNDASFINSLSLYLFYNLIIAVTIGTIEASFARLRMNRIFEFIFFISSLALIVFALSAVKFYGN